MGKSKIKYTYLQAALLKRLHITRLEYFNTILYENNFYLYLLVF